MIATSITESNPTPQPDFAWLRQIPADLLKKLGADKPSPGALTALRKIVGDGELYRLAADLPRARRKLRHKLLHAATAFSDIPRAEMATARPVALYRMGRLLRAAVALHAAQGATAPAPALADLTCGAGADFCALLELCRAWHLPIDRLAAFEQDPFTAWCAAANAAALGADSDSLAANLIRREDVAALPPRAPGRPPFPPDTALFLDPTRRAGGKRTVNDWAQCEPPDRLWLPWVDDARQPTAVKVAPAFDWRNFRPRTPVQIEALQWHGEVHELTLWWNFAPPIGDFAAEPTTAADPHHPHVTREWIDHPLAFDQPAGTRHPGRRATVIHADPLAAPAALRYESLYLAPNQDEAQRARLSLVDTPPNPGDLLAIPAPAVLRMDLTETLALSLHAAVYAAQPHLIQVPPTHAAAAQRTLLCYAGRVTALVPAREKDLRRALNADLKHRRWQPQVLGLKQTPDLQKLTRVIEQHSARTANTPPAGVALLTRFHPSHLIVFLEPLT